MIYRLKRDLPTFMMGDLFELKADGCLYWLGGGVLQPGWGSGHWKHNVMAYHKKTLAAFPNILEEWFEALGKTSAIANVALLGKDVVIKMYSQDEAERMAEKMEALQRLNAKGLEFDYVGGYENLCGNGFEIPITATMPPEQYNNKAVAEDLKVLFGGKE